MTHQNEIQLLCTFPSISEMMDSLHWLIYPTSRISCGPAKTPASALVWHWVSKVQPDTVHCPESACFAEEGPRRVSKGGILKAMDLEWSQFFMGRNCISLGLMLLPLDSACCLLFSWSSATCHPHLQFDSKSSLLLESPFCHFFFPV